MIINFYLLNKLRTYRNFFFLFTNFSFSCYCGQIERKKIEHQIKKMMLKHFLIIVGIIGFRFSLHYQYQGKEKCPFNEHENLIVSLSSFGSLYALALWAKFKPPWGTDDFKLKIINRFSPLFGTLVIGQLLIVLLLLLGLDFVIC